MSVETCKIRIMIAEDHVMVREGIRQVLEKEVDFEVVGEASDGYQALQMALDIHPDIIVMDLVMPGLGGIEAAKQIKANLPNAAIILVSGFDYGPYAVAALEAGISGFLSKKLGGNELIAAVRAAHLGQTVLDSATASRVLSQLAGANQLLGRSPGENLSQREVEILRFTAQGLSTKAIARKLGLNDRTAQSHLNSIFRKLGVGSRTEAVTQALKLKLISLDDIP